MHGEMEILAPISLGELIDKITILEIKQSKFNGDQLKNVLQEINSLKHILKQLPVNINVSLVEKLRKTNHSLWDIEDQIREHERTRNFNSDFVTLARLVYQTNDLRSSIKKEINITHGSSIIEEKSYSDYA